MPILINTKKEDLDNFISSQEHSQFLESWEWGEFQKKAGNKVFRIALRQSSLQEGGQAGQGVEENGELAVTATLIKKQLPFGRSYFFCPRGPVVEITNYELGIRNFFEEIRKLAKKERAIFLRFEPIFGITNNQETITKQIIKSKFQIIKTIDIQPSKTLILDLSKSEEVLLNTMHQKTRYNIRLAEKKGVRIREGNLDDFEDFWKIMEETNKRDGFRLHGEEYYRKMLENFKFQISNFQSMPNAKCQMSNLLIKLFLAEYQGKIIAGNVVSFFGDTATYMHGASSNEHRNIMAPYLLQWHSIKSAKEQDYKYYDFFGIDDNKWPGVTRFKLGFGGREIEYPGTFDLAFDKMWYNVYRLTRRIRRVI